MKHQTEMHLLTWVIGVLTVGALALLSFWLWCEPSARADAPILNRGVTEIGEAGSQIPGSVVLAEGSNVTITRVGQTITFAAAGGAVSDTVYVRLPNANEWTTAGTGSDNFTFSSTTYGPVISLPALDNNRAITSIPIPFSAWGKANVKVRFWLAPGGITGGTAHRIQISMTGRPAGGETYSAATYVDDAATYTLGTQYYVYSFSATFASLLASADRFLLIRFLRDEDHAEDTCTDATYVIGGELLFY